MSNNTADSPDFDEYGVFIEEGEEESKGERGQDEVEGTNQMMLEIDESETLQLRLKPTD